MCTKVRTIYWVDDLRDPKEHLVDRNVGDTVMWFETYDEFVKAIIRFPLPDVIWFDHDLGAEKSGKDCANFLVDFCLSNGLPLPAYNSQSQNPVGKENIIKLLDSYNKFYKENIEQ